MMYVPMWIFSFAALVLTKLLLYAAVLAGSLLKEPDFPIDIIRMH